MQERRTTVRTRCNYRAQYCAADDLLPRDGQLINISERGAGLLVREPRRAGEQITASFSLPGDNEPLTATGVIRWSLPPVKGRWYPLGLEWLPLEEAARSRLHGFLSQPKAEPQRVLPSGAGKPMPSWVLGTLWVVAVVLVGVVAWLWVGMLSRQADLEQDVAQRNVAISALKHREQRLAAREAWLAQELVNAKMNLATAAGELSRLDGQAQDLTTDAQRLNQEVGLFEQSYAKVQQERTGLIQQVMNLEQERLKLVGKLSSLPDLHMAIRNAIEARKAESAADSGGFAWSIRRSADSAIEEDDNRGFIVRNGQSTLSRRNGATMWIKVHEPEASAP